MAKNSSPVFGTVQKSQHYDLPLQARLGTEFLPYLMMLMTFLCVLAAGISISLNRMADLWTSGLTNTAMIEIPSDGAPSDLLKSLQEKLQRNSSVESVEILDDSKVSELINPWLGQGTIEMADLPIPTLVTVKLRDKSNIEELKSLVHAEIPEAKINTHEEWLVDLAKVSHALQYAGLILVLIIGVVTSLTISGAVKSRMAIHHSELELLHLMGAADNYITRQFQKYILFQAGKGILFGLIAAIILTILTKIALIKIPDTLPGFDIAASHIGTTFLVAATLLILCLLTARRTALGILRQMP